MFKQKYEKDSTQNEKKGNCLNERVTNPIITCNEKPIVLPAFVETKENVDEFRKNNCF